MAMLRLTTFGGIGISRDGASIPGAAEGWRRRALLALVAIAPPNGVSRDLMTRLLWPDSEPEDGRHSLDQLLYTIRRALGANPFRAGEALGFDDQVLATDVVDFQMALRQRQFDRVAALYLGDFADGLELDASDEALRRVEAARLQFANDRAAALESLARGAAEDKDLLAAIKWRQQLAESDPLNGRAASGYIAALVAGGERASALKFALLHATLVKEEVGAPPEAAVAEWIERLRDTSSNGIAPALNRSERLARVIGRRYELGALLSDGNVTADFSAHSADDARTARLVRLVQPRLVLRATESRFREVMDRVARLSHTHLQATFEFGASDDLLYVVTAPRAPRSLRDRLRAERALPVADVLATARDLAVALSAAHSSGVRHGDLRPKHIDLFSGKAVLTGLGLAEALTPLPRGDATSTVITIGSPAYLSPEQLLREAPADARSDVYALGSILYEMLTGEPPFGRAPHADAVAAKLSGAHTPVRERRDTTSAGLAQVVDTCLARVPADRFASATELAEALARVA